VVYLKNASVCTNVIHAHATPYNMYAMSLIYNPSHYTHPISSPTPEQINALNTSPNAMQSGIYNAKSITLMSTFLRLYPSQTHQNSSMTAAKKPNQAFHPTPVFSAILSMRFIVPLRRFLEFSN
jgi:hypothetical protein